LFGLAVTFLDQVLEDLRRKQLLADVPSPVGVFTTAFRSLGVTARLELAKNPGAASLELELAASFGATALVELGTDFLGVFLRGAMMKSRCNEQEKGRDCVNGSSPEAVAAKQKL
jgi:hypothetical protein